jgi:hypothetical protein
VRHLAQNVMEIKESTVLHRIKDNSIKLVKEVGIGD